jgi:hypothetical protein
MNTYYVEFWKKAYDEKAFFEIKFEMSTQSCFDTKIIAHEKGRCESF